jgi:hypothetical protein
LLAVVSATIGVGGSFGTVALGAETRLVPSLSARTTYDDNIFFDEVSDWELKASPELAYQYETEVTSLSFSGGVDVYRYLDEDQYDRENQAYSLHYNYGLLERLSLSLMASTFIDYTFENVLEETGEITSKNKRYRYNLQPGLKFELTPRNFVSFTLRGSKVDYSQGNEDDDRDYDAYGLNLVFGHEWSQNTTLFLVADYSLIDVDDFVRTLDAIEGKTLEYGQFDQDQEIYQLLGGVDHSFSENLHLSVRTGASLAVTEYTAVTPVFIGPFLTDTRRKDYDDDSYGFVLDVGLDYNLQRMTLGLDLSQNVTQSADGENINRTRLRFSLIRQISSRLSGVVRATFVRSKTVEDSEGLYSDDEVDIWTYALAPGLRYALGEFSQLELRYSYRAVDDESDDDFETRNKVYLQYSLNFPVIME